MLICLRNILLSELETVELLNMFVETVINPGFFDEWKKTACFCNIINVLNVTFDQFNVSMLNKGIHLFQQQQKKIFLTPNCYTTYFHPIKCSLEW